MLHANHFSLYEQLELFKLITFTQNNNKHKKEKYLHFSLENLVKFAAVKKLYNS